MNTRTSCGNKKMAKWCDDLTRCKKLRPIACNMSAQQFQNLRNCLTQFFVEPCEERVSFLRKERKGPSLALWSSFLMQTDQYFVQHVCHSNKKTDNSHVPWQLMREHRQAFELAMFPTWTGIEFLYDVCHRAMDATESDYVAILRQATVFTETCLQKSGVHTHSYGKSKGAIREWPACEVKNSSSTVLFTEWRDGHFTQDEILDTVLRDAPRVFIIAGSLEMSSDLLHLDAHLLATGYERRLYALDALAYDHVVADGSESSAMVAVYGDLDVDMTFFEPSTLLTPERALRYHIVRHVLRGETKQRWLDVVHTAPLKLLVQYGIQDSCCQAILDFYMSDAHETIVSLDENEFQSFAENMFSDQCRDLVEEDEINDVLCDHTQSDENQVASTSK